MHSENPNDKVKIGFSSIEADRKTRWVRNQFDAVARRYDFMNTLLSFGIHYLWKARTIRLLDLQPGERVLDVCGGTGDLAVSAMRKTGEGGSVVIYDINRKMMQAGRGKRSHALLREKIGCVEGDAEEMAVGDACFDAVVVGYGVRNLTRLSKGFSEMFRVLKPGGRMACLEFSRPVSPFFRSLYDFYSFRIMPAVGELITGSREAYTYLPESIRVFPSPEALCRMLEEIGFSEVRFERLTNGISAIHRAVKPMK